MHSIFQTFDDDTSLLNPLGYILFWTQFGLGLSLFLGLVIAIGLLIWCKNKHRRWPRVDAEQPGPNPEESEPNRETNLCTERPAISGPINNLHSAWDEADSDSEESRYEEENPYTDPYQGNPFQGWSSFRPVGPPPPPPHEAIQMVTVKPVAKIDKSTMTVESDCSMTKRTSKARSDIRSGYVASPETSLDRSINTMASARPKQKNHSLNRSQNGTEPAYDEGPLYELPPLPVRSSSIRRKNRRKKKNATSTAATMS